MKKIVTFILAEMKEKATFFSLQFPEKNKKNIFSECLIFKEKFVYLNGAIKQ